MLTRCQGHPDSFIQEGLKDKRPPQTWSRTVWRHRAGPRRTSPHQARLSWPRRPAVQLGSRRNEASAGTHPLPGRPGVAARLLAQLEAQVHGPGLALDRLQRRPQELGETQVEAKPPQSGSQRAMTGHGTTRHDLCDPQLFAKQNPQGLCRGSSLCFLFSPQNWHFPAQGSPAPGYLSTHTFPPSPPEAAALAAALYLEQKLLPLSRVQAALALPCKAGARKPSVLLSAREEPGGSLALKHPPAPTPEGAQAGRLKP